MAHAPGRYAGHYVGQPIKRVEDRRFLTGKGRYVGDIKAPDAAHLAFVRSPHAHARIRKLSTAAARKMPGVIAVLTAAEWKAAGLGRLPLWRIVPSTDGVEREQMSWAVFADGQTRYVGEIVAAVIADTLARAQDAAEAVEVDYDPRPAITDTARAADPDTPIVHDGIGSNVFFLRDVGDAGAAKAAFARAHHVTELAIRNNRVTANSMEPRNALGLYDSVEDRYTLYVSHQAPHMLRRSLADHVLNHPEHKIRVVAPDVGGGFGMKVVDHPEDAIVLYASRLADRPVRWTATRSEGHLADVQGRDHYTTCRMAFDKDGRILALEADTIANLGAYQTHRGASIPGYFYSSYLIGLYQTPTFYCRTRGVHTHTVPVHAYRGAGRPEAASVLERLLENGAREMGLDPMEVRRRNLLSANQFPYEAPHAFKYDSGDPPGMFSKMRAMSKYEALRAEQKRMGRGGVLMGIGAGIGVDSMGVPSGAGKGIAARMGGWDSAAIRVHPSGKISVMAGVHSHGQGHATTFAQLAAERLLRPVEDIEIIEGDTDRTPFGHGTWGSRSTVTSGMAVVEAADKIAAKCRKIAAHFLECADGDLVHDQDGFRIAGTDRLLSFREVVDRAYRGIGLPAGVGPALEETSFYDPRDRNMAYAMHMAVVLVDTETGRVRLRDYFAVDDCGVIINPMILEGQIHGGLAQGIGQALMEELSIDHETGQVLAGSFMDYAMPRADDLPSFTLDSMETPTPHNAIGVKGGGESGTIASLPAMMNAVVDALWHLGVRHVEMPMRPAQVWRAIRDAGRNGR